MAQLFTSMRLISPTELILFSSVFFFFFWRNSPTRARAASSLRFLDHTQLHTTASRIPLDEWPARGRDLYLTTHNIHKRQTSMLPAGFEPAFPASKRPQTFALARSVTGMQPSILVSCCLTEVQKTQQQDRWQNILKRATVYTSRNKCNKPELHSWRY